MLFDDEAVDVKFIPPTNRATRRSSFLSQDRPILNFDPENGTAFKIWKQKWESWIYMATSAEGFLTEEKKFHLLIGCFSDSTMKDIFELGLENERNPDTIIEGLASLLTTGKNHHRYRLEFNSRKQSSNESVDSWIASLRSSAKFAKFDSDCCSKCLESRILERLIFGVHSPEVRELLLDVGPALTLDQAVRLIRKFDDFRNSNPDIQNRNLNKIRLLPGNITVTVISGDTTASSTKPDDQIGRPDQARSNEGIQQGSSELDLGPEASLRLATVSGMNILTVAHSKQPTSTRDREQSVKPEGRDPKAVVETNPSVLCGPGMEIFKISNQDNLRAVRQPERKASIGNRSALNRPGSKIPEVGEKLNPAESPNSRHVDRKAVANGIKRKSAEHSARLEPVLKEPKTALPIPAVDKALTDSRIVFDIHIKSEAEDDFEETRKKAHGNAAKCSTCGGLQASENLDERRNCRSCQGTDLTKKPIPGASKKQPRLQRMAPIKKLSTTHLS